MEYANQNGESPRDLDAEKSVVGSNFLNADVLETVRGKIGASDFYDATNGAVFQATLDCWEVGDPVDAVTVAERLQANGRLADIGGVDAIIEFLDAVPHAAHADYYAHVVADKSRRRRCSPRP